MDKLTQINLFNQKMCQGFLFVKNGKRALQEAAEAIGMEGNE